MAYETLTAEQERRQVALQAMDKIADTHGIIDRVWREVDFGDSIQLLGMAPDGREYGIGYMKQTEREKAGA